MKIILNNEVDNSEKNTQLSFVYFIFHLHQEKFYFAVCLYIIVNYIIHVLNLSYKQNTQFEGVTSGSIENHFLTFN